MITVLAIQEKNVNSLLSEVFGRSKCFLFINSEDDSKEIICNPYAPSFGGAGIQASQILIENNCDVLITKFIGTHAYSFLKSANIKTYLTTEDDVEGAIKAYEAGLLKEVNDDILCGNGKNRHRRRHGRNRNN